MRGPGVFWNRLRLLVLGPGLSAALVRNAAASDLLDAAIREALGS